MIYFALWLSAIFYLLYATIIFFALREPAIGIIFGSEKVIMGYIFGITSVLLAIYSILVRFKLARYHRKAPSFFLSLYAIEIVISVIYMLFMKSVLDPKYDAVNEIPFIFLSVIILLANRKYYRKRAHLFVN